MEKEIANWYKDGFGTDFYHSLCQEGNLREAVKLLDKAIALDWRFAEAYYKRGKIKIDLGDYSSAMEDFSTAIKLNKDLRFS